MTAEKNVKKYLPKSTCPKTPAGKYLPEKRMYRLT
jgi:hypothetical protein